MVAKVKELVVALVVWVKELLVAVKDAVIQIVKDRL